MNVEKQIKVIIGCGFKVYNSLGFGFLESVYHNSLIHELEKNGIATKRECPIPVWYDGIIAGSFYADIVANEKIIIELKSVQSIVPSHELQLVNYLAATKLDTGLILNFADNKLQVKRKYRKYTPKQYNNIKRYS